MARVDVRGPIVPNEYKEWYEFFGEDCTVPRDIQAAVDTLPDGEGLDVYINSPGGEIASGSEIYAILRACNRTRIHVVGQAHSAASIVAMSGWSEMAPTALMMVHCVSTYAGGNHADMEHAAEVLRTADEALCTAYTEKSGMTKKDALAMMEHETWLTAEQAKAKGLIDQVMFEESKQSDMVAFDGGFKLPSKEQLEAVRREKEKGSCKNRQVRAQLELLKLNRR